MSWLEHKIPPPVVGALCALFMWCLSVFTYQVAWWGTGAQIVTAILVIVGLLFDSSGLLSFIRSKTTINPVHIERASHLVTSGIYRATRNPMYLGMAFLLTALAIWLEAPLAFTGPILFVLYITRFQIIPEERILVELFGDEYQAYKSKVRRWI
ncbi:MAG: isoprenylcysteine carboxylmethyltransferase family protein [Thalassolituus sp.]